MSKHQRSFVIGCLLLALNGSVIWFARERTFEPIIVFLATLGSLASVYWPRLMKYENERTKGKASFDYSNNNGIYRIGSGELTFDTQWSKASDSSIHCLRDQPTVKGVAIAYGVARITDIADASIYEMSSKNITPQEFEIVVLKNNFGNFACLRIVDVKDRTRSDLEDKLEIEYVINPNQRSDFR